VIDFHESDGVALDMTERLKDMKALNKVTYE
jgi:hypothetical protein